MNEKNNSEKMNGRFTGIDVTRFESNNRIAEALDTSTNELVILKSFEITRGWHYPPAKDEAEMLRKLG